VAERLSLIVGSGALVPEVISAARRRGYNLQVLSLLGRRWSGGTAAVPFSITRPWPALDAMRAFAPDLLALVGGLRLSDRTREAMLEIAGKDQTSVGDTGISALTSYLTQASGARLVGVHEIAPELVAGEGLIAGPEPGLDLRETGVFALGLARRAGNLDLGQGIVVSGRRAIATEDVAGTDALLQRVRAYRRFGLAADGASPLVFSKAAKPDQPHRVDLPAIGPRTVANARRAGVALIVVQAGATLLVERDKLVAAANAARLPILGLPASDD
jgi:DUF1009 family protein